MHFAKFPSIESFHYVVALTRKYLHLVKNSATYKGKIKLHGTNVAIRIFSGEIACQSRTGILPNIPGIHWGFNDWVLSNEKYWKEIQHKEPITIFGEWCGPGIAKKTAIQKIPNKIFAVFAIMIGSVGDKHKEESNRMIFDPKEIAKILGNVPENLHILPWMENQEFVIDYKNRENLLSTADSLNKIIEEIEPCDPWVKSTFDVEGIAEGIVYYPVEIDSSKVICRKQFSDLSFKAKGAKHKVNRTEKSVQIEPEIVENVSQFIEMFLTEPRFEQAIQEIGGVDIKKTGEFLKWILRDILKESTEELEASNLTWDDVSKRLQNEAKTKYLSKCKEI